MLIPFHCPCSENKKAEKISACLAAISDDIPAIQVALQRG
jgi:hypothetical protein